MTNTHMEESCSVCNFKSLIKDPTCFKNPEKPTTIDHILTNHTKSVFFFILAKNVNLKYLKISFFVLK